MGVFTYYGLPLILNSSDENLFEPYRYVMNNYKPNIEYPILGDNCVNNNYYIKYDDLSEYGYSSISYYDNIKLAKLITLYIGTLYDYISDIQTNYTKTFNQSMLISSAITSITQRILDIYTFIYLTTDVHIFNVEGCNYDIDEIKSLIRSIDSGIPTFNMILSYRKTKCITIRRKHKMLHSYQEKNASVHWRYFTNLISIPRTPYCLILSLE